MGTSGLSALTHELERLAHELSPARHFKPQQQQQQGQQRGLRHQCTVTVSAWAGLESGESSVSQRQSIRKLRQNIANMRTPPVECILDSGLGETGCSLEGGGTGFGSHGPQAWLTHSTPSSPFSERA